MTTPPPGEPSLPASWRQIGALAKVEAAVLLVAAPFLFFPTLSLPATLLALISLGVVWLVPLLLQRQPGLPGTPYNMALIPWGLLLAVAIMVTADPEQTLPKATGVILGLAVWRVVVIFARDRALVNLSLAGFVALGAGLTIAGALGLDEVLKIPGLARLAPAQAFSLSERFGLTTHPNQLAGLICLFLPFLVALALGWRPATRRGVVWRLLLALLMIMVFWVLLITQSRGGWVGVAGGLYVLLAAWAILMRPSTARRLARVAALTLVVAAAAAFIAIGPERVQQLWLDPPADTAVGTFTTLNYRKQLWPWALAAAGDFAVTGTGLGTFREVAFRLYPVQIAANADIGHAHNIFLQTALDVGVPGLVVYVALLLTAAGSAWAVARRDERYRPEALGLLAGLAALHLYGLADALALGSKPGIMYWYALGLIAAMSLTASRPAPAQPAA